ncbi:MAG: flagellar basal-body rod protein FlgG [Leptospirillia bacterium]
MMRSLFTATTGLVSQQMNLDVVSNNLANVNTTGFKKSRADFEDLLYQTIQVAGTETTLGTQEPTSVQVGLGVRPLAVERIHTQGSLEGTDNPLDMAIEGEGFFQVIRENGEIGYTRAGIFQRDAVGNVVTPNGLPLEPAITVPSDATDIIISPTGAVSVLQGTSSTQTQIGQIQLARFANDVGLHSLGGNLLAPSAASGDPTVGNPGDPGYGGVTQGFVEGSNVNIAEELVNMIVGQRAYEVNSKAVQTADEMLQLANNLKR